MWSLNSLFSKPNFRNLPCGFMNYKMNYQEEPEQLETKIETINKVKEKFNQVIKQKLGELLIDGISEYIGEDQLNYKQLKIIKIPQVLKPMFYFFNDDQLLIDTSIQYILYCLDLITNEIYARYNENIQIITRKKDELMAIKDLLWVNMSQTSEYVCKYKVPNVLYDYLINMEKEFEEIIIFGLLKIFEWLNLLNSTALGLIPKYEQSFIKAQQITSQND